MPSSYDAILIVSFGGPEGMDDVLPFLQNVTRGRNVPPERLSEVVHHYEMFGGHSPINSQNRSIIERLQKVLAERGPHLPVYWGNRNWHPFLKDTLVQMESDEIKSAIAFVTSAYSSYSSCRQYLEDIDRAKQELSSQIQIDKLRPFYNHPLFIEANAEHLEQVLSEIDEQNQSALHVVFTAHSIPMSMANNCKYASQLQEACELVAEKLGLKNWHLAYQSRSGPPAVPWLEPDILDKIRELHKQGVNEILIQPLGFVSDHMEVIYDLDFEAKELCAELQMTMHRAETASTNPKFIEMIRELLLERIEGSEAKVLGESGALPDSCPPGCCPLGATRPATSSASHEKKN